MFISEMFMELEIPFPKQRCMETSHLQTFKAFQRTLGNTGLYCIQVRKFPFEFIQVLEIPIWIYFPQIESERLFGFSVPEHCRRSAKHF